MPHRDWNTEVHLCDCALRPLDLLPHLTTSPETSHLHTERAIAAKREIIVSFDGSVEPRAIKRRAVVEHMFTKFTVAVASTVMHSYDAHINASVGGGRIGGGSAVVNSEGNATASSGSKAGEEAKGAPGRVDLPPLPEWLAHPQVHEAFGCGESVSGCLRWYCGGVFFEMIPLGECPMNGKSLTRDAGEVRAIYDHARQPLAGTTHAVAVGPCLVFHCVGCF